MPAFTRRFVSPFAVLATLVAAGLLGSEVTAASFCSFPDPRPRSIQGPPNQLTSGAILHRMQKLDVVGSVLYLAAHPDDENTRLISWLSNGRKVRTAYLSLTRGDGGQNLIGPELGAGLGVIRTQELLEARRVDGGEQFFSRAVDFGYCKSPEEALAKWGKDEVLGDVVRVVRTFRPDVIVTRFDVDGSGGHGHHTASALLAREAFRMAADPAAYPEQLKEGLRPWATKRLFFNGSTWWRLDLRDHALANPDRWVGVNVGGYNSLLGMSYNEMAGRARSQHRSQGFGSALRRGAEHEYLRLDLGPQLSGDDMFEGIDLTWERIHGGGAAGEAVEALLHAYAPIQPGASLGGLLDLRAQVRRLLAEQGDSGPDAVWLGYTIEQVEELLLQVTGTVLEAKALRPTVARGGSLPVTLAANQRSPGSFFRWKGLTGPSSGPEGPVQTVVGETIPWNEAFTVEVQLQATKRTPIDEPYWLARPFGTLYDPSGTGHTGIEPQSRTRPTYTLDLEVAQKLDVAEAGEALAVRRALMHTWVERVEGQRSRPVAVTPVASVEPRDPVVMVTGRTARVAVEVEALCESLDGRLLVDAPSGWTVMGETEPIVALKRGQRSRFMVELERTDSAEDGALRFTFAGPLGSADRTMHLIDYPHITPQVWYSAAEVRLVPLDVDINVASVGYIHGAGDAVPSALRRLGATVETIDPGTVQPEELTRFDAIVVGIRAYNAVQEMSRVQEHLMDFVQAGGTLVVQYNTASRDMVIEPAYIGPFPFELTRGRVTVEEAPATLLLPDHPLLNVPNRITAADFDGWVQERGLYFAGDYDGAYSAPIAWNDPGEAPLDGALIACDFGKGRFIYTGISFFRELPAGVPGAYRLFANLLSRRTAR